MTPTLPSTRHDNPFGRLHRGCFVCDPTQSGGLGMRFVVLAPGHVTASVHVRSAWKGYDRRIHGGVAAAMLDGAMTHALFSAGVAAVTASLQVRYSRPVEIGKDCTVEARRIRFRRPLHHIWGVILQEGRECVEARASFLEDQEMNSTLEKRT